MYDKTKTHGRGSALSGHATRYGCSHVITCMYDPASWHVVAVSVNVHAHHK